MVSKKLSETITGKRATTRRDAIGHPVGVDALKRRLNKNREKAKDMVKGNTGGYPGLRK